MRRTIVQRYLREALEFFAYFIFMTLLGAAMYVLVNYAPQANSRWYINTCIVVAMLTGAYSFRMYRRFRLALRLVRAGRPVPVEIRAPELSAEERRTLRWAERIAAERLEAQGGDPVRVKLLDELEALEREYRAKCELLGEDPDGDDDFEIDPNMSIEAIRARIAERMDREDREEEDARRIFR